METDKPTDSTDSTPVRRRRTISGVNTSTPAAADPDQPRNRTRKLPGTFKSTTQETNIRRKRKSERSKSKPQVGDSRPASPIDAEVEATPKPGRQRRRRGNKGKGKSTQPRAADQTGKPVEAILEDQPVTLGKEQLERRRGRERKGRPVGRYQMLVHVHEGVTHIAVLEGRSLIEHYVSRPSDDVSEIHGNIYLGKVQNVLPGMEAAFVDIGTPKNAVLYRGDVTYDREDLDGGKAQPPAPKAKNPRTRFGRTQNEARIEDLLSTRQSILCQVTKNPIAHKGARLSTEVSLPGRFVVLVPNSDTYGISKRLGDRERLSPYRRPNR